MIISQFNSDSFCLADFTVKCFGLLDTPLLAMSIFKLKKYLPLFDMTLTIIMKHFCHKKNRLPAWRHDFVNKTKNRNGFCKFRYPDCGPSDVIQIVINKIKTLTQDVTGADLFGRLDLSEWHSWFLMLLRCWVSTDRWHPPPHLRREYYAPKPTTPLNQVMSPLIF